MSAERCPECDAVGADCECATGAGFEPLRVRPYVTLPEPGQAEGPPPPQPVRGVVAGPPGGCAGGAPTPPGEDTPAYGIPVAWPDSPPQAGWPAETARLRPVEPAGGVSGAASAAASRPRPSRKRRLPTVLAGAGTLVAVGSVALALGMLPHSGESETVLLDAKPSAPAVSVAPAGPTQSATTRAPSRSASPSASASPSPSASKSASPSASPSASRSSAPPSPTPSTSTSRPQSPPPAPKGPTLRYGDSGPEVEKMQRLLARRGYYRGRINGRFDSRTENAVSDFQWQNGIDDDWGVYGPPTRTALEG